MDQDIDFSKTIVRGITVSICGDRCTCGGKGGKCSLGFEEEAKDAISTAQTLCTKFKVRIQDIKLDN